MNDSDATADRFPPRENKTRARKWIAAMTVLTTVMVVAGLCLPLFRMPLLGEMSYSDLHGCGRAKAWVAGVLSCGSVLLLFGRFPGLAAAIGLAGSGTLVHSLALFAWWLKGRLAELESSGLLSGGGIESNLLPGGWSLTLGAVGGGLCWITMAVLLLKKSRRAPSRNPVWHQ